MVCVFHKGLQVEEKICWKECNELQGAQYSKTNRSSELSHTVNNSADYRQKAGMSWKKKINLGLQNTITASVFRDIS